MGFFVEVCQVIGQGNISANLNLFCKSSMCTEKEAVKTDTVVGPSWARKCGFVGNVCSSCSIVDLRNTIKYQGIIRVPVEYFRISEWNSEERILYTQEAVKMAEYFLDFVLSYFPNYIIDSTAILHIKYALML